MLQGRFEHNLDDKGRVAVPSAFRRSTFDESTETGNLVYITISDQCLAAYPKAEWDRKITQIGALNQLDPRVLAFKRIFVGCAQECQIDKAGRILIPQDLRRDAGIEREIVLVGQIDKFEIWSRDRWDRTFPQMTDQLGGIYQSLADLGIQL